MTTSFQKWQALGNDYLILERERLAFKLSAARVRKLCEGHFGIYADGVLELSLPADGEDVADLRIFNPDGSEAELSGNGAREAILYLRHNGWTDKDAFSIHTAAGRIRPQITGPDTCRVDMGRASLTSRDFPDGPADGKGATMSNGRLWPFQHVSIGNPQCAIQVASIEELEALELPAIGPAIEAGEQFPNRTNVSWYTELEPGTPGAIRARIFERGGGGDALVGDRGDGRRLGACARIRAGATPRASDGGARWGRADGRGERRAAGAFDRLGQARVRGQPQRGVRKGAV